MGKALVKEWTHSAQCSPAAKCHVVPSATGSEEKRKTHECQVHQDHIDYVDIADAT